MEEDFFLKKMKGVKPFKKDEKIRIETTHLSNKNKKKDNSQILLTNTKTNTTKKKNNQEYNLSFGDLNKDLKRGKIKINRRIDLHGYNMVDAEKKFKNEIVQNYNKNKRCLLIITGKGIVNKKNNETISNDDKPKLYYGKIKNSITSWVEDENLKKYILTYQDAGIEHGGDGAIFIYLRKKKI